jgi:hypothetical protein
MWLSGRKLTTDSVPSPPVGMMAERDCTEGSFFRDERTDGRTDGQVGAHNSLTVAVQVTLSWEIMTAFGGPVVPLVSTRRGASVSTAHCGRCLRSDVQMSVQHWPGWVLASISSSLACEMGGGPDRTARPCGCSAQSAH